MSQNFIEPQGKQADTQLAIFEMLMNTMYPLVGYMEGCDDPECVCGGKGQQGAGVVKDSLVN